MKVLVTGGAGFIGSHLTDRLISGGYQVAVIDNLSEGQRSYIHSGVSFWEADVAGPELKELLSAFRPEVCIHLAESGSPLPQALLSSMNPDMRALIYLLDLCREYEVKKVIYASSAEIYGVKNNKPVDEETHCAPKSWLGLSKLGPEEYLRAFSELYDLEYTIMRFTCVYGARMQRRGDHLMRKLLDSMITGERPHIYGSRSEAWDFIHISDAVEALMKALTAGGSQIYNVGAGQAAELDDLLQLLQERFGTFVRPVFKPAKTSDRRNVSVDISKASRELGWRPRVKLQEGLTMTVSEEVYRAFMDKLTALPLLRKAGAAGRLKRGRRTVSGE